MLNKIQERLSIIIKYAIIIMCIVIGISAFFVTFNFDIEINNVSEKCKIKIDNIIFNIIYVFIGMGILYGFYKISNKINKKLLVVIMITISMILGFCWVNYVKFYPNSDQVLMVYCADNLLNKTGNLVLEPGQYLDRYPHQLGFVIYVMIIFKLLNLRSNMIILQNLNVIYSVINCIIMYFIAKELFKEEKVHKISAVLIGMFSILYWTFFDVHIYGNIPGLMFALIAVLFTIKFLKNRKIYNVIIIASSLAISYLLKSNYQIFMLGILLVLVLDIIKNGKFKYILSIFGILVITFGLKLSVYTTFEKGTGYSLDGGVPMLSYIYMGIAPGDVYPAGWYTGDVEIIYNESNFDKEESFEKSKQLYLDRLSYFCKHPIQAIAYFGEKFETTWLNPTYQSLWCSTPGYILDINKEYNEYIKERPLIKSILCGNIYIILENIMDTFQIVFYLSVAYGVYKLKQEEDLKYLIIPVVVLGGLLFHIIWETKAIYVIQYYYILIPFAAYGIYLWCKYIEENKIIEKIINKIKRPETK